METDYSVRICPEGKQYIAHARPLDVAGSGKTPDAARLALNEAVKLFVSSAEETGTLDEIFLSALSVKSVVELLLSGFCVNKNPPAMPRLKKHLTQRRNDTETQRKRISMQDSVELVC